MSAELDKLNRMRANINKPPLVSWKASKNKLTEAIKNLEAQGVSDVVTGANPQAKPVTDDPVVAKTLPSEEEKKEPETKKVKAQLAKGLETDTMARQSRIAVQMQREREREEAKEAKREEKAAKKKDKKKKKEKLPKGQVDPEKDPEKAKRQQEHIKAKKEAREKSGKKAAKSKAGDDEITVADIARDLGIDPKVARAKLRRHEDRLKSLHTKGQDRWVFPKSAQKEISKILK